MKTEPQSKCSDCIYFHVIDDERDEGEGTICRRYPPDRKGRWPTVWKYAWCGEFLSNDEAQLEEDFADIAAASQR